MFMLPVGATCPWLCKHSLPATEPFVCGIMGGNGSEQARAGQQPALRHHVHNQVLLSFC